MQAETPPGIFIHGRLIAAPAALRASFVNSSGPGGQNVNKRATKCVLRVFVRELALAPTQAQRVLAMGSHYVVGADSPDAAELVITADENRSQERNHAACVEKLRELIIRAWAAPKVRRATRPTRGSKERRLGEKKRRGDVKRERRARDE